MPRLPRLLAVCGVVVMAWASSTPTSLAAVANVSLENISFVPAKVEISVGDSVVWSHNDNVQQHTITAAPGQGEDFDFPAGCGPLAGSCMEQGEIFTHRFDAAGTFDYFCNVHCRDGDCPAGGMRGQVVVNPALDPTPTPDQELDPEIEEPEADPEPTPPPPPAPTPPPLPTFEPVPFTTPLALELPTNEARETWLPVAGSVVGASTLFGLLALWRFSPGYYRSRGSGL